MAQELPKLYITQIEQDRPVDHIYAFDPDMGHRIIDSVHGMGTATLTMEMALTPGSEELIWSLAKQKDGFTFGVERHEWKCIWCGRVNTIEQRECDSCGGPRGWIL